MTRRGIAWTLVAFLVAAVLAGFVIESLKTLQAWNIRTVGAAIGAGLALFVIGGLLPIVIWAFRRFRAEAAGGPLYAWAIIMFVCALFAGHGAITDDRSKREAWLAQVNLTGKDRSDFVASTRRSCGASQKQSAVNVRMGVTDRQIASYCECYASSLADVITINELRDYIQRSVPSEATKAKIADIELRCWLTALGRSSNQP